MVTPASFWGRARALSSCELKKVVSDILGEIEFVVDIESTCKMHSESWFMSRLKAFTFYWQNKMSKTMKYKFNVSTKLLFPQNVKNAHTIFLHSTDDIGAK